MFHSASSPSARRPSSRSACTTQLRIACADGSNSRAKSSGVRPARTSSIIWRRYSGAYGGLDLGMMDTSFPKDQVSTKADQLQSCFAPISGHRAKGRQSSKSTMPPAWSRHARRPPWTPTETSSSIFRESTRPEFASRVHIGGDGGAGLWSGGRGRQSCGRGCDRIGPNRAADPRPVGFEITSPRASSSCPVSDSTEASRHCSTPAPMQQPARRVRHPGDWSHARLWFMRSYE